MADFIMSGLLAMFGLTINRDIAVTLDLSVVESAFGEFGCECFHGFDSKGLTHALQASSMHGMSSALHPAVREYLREITSRGGKAGSRESKVRAANVRWSKTATERAEKKKAKNLLVVPTL